jgi:hypothetical protein
MELRRTVDGAAQHLSTIPAERAKQPVTLDYFVRDYVAHLKHHLAQIPE